MDMLGSNYSWHCFALTASRQHRQSLSNVRRRMPLKLSCNGRPLSYSISLRTVLWNHLLQLTDPALMKFSVRSNNKQFHEVKWDYSLHHISGCFNVCYLLFAQLLFLPNPYFKKLIQYAICSVPENRMIRND